MSGEWTRKQPSSPDHSTILTSRKPSSTKGTPPTRHLGCLAHLPDHSFGEVGSMAGFGAGRRWSMAGLEDGISPISC